MPKNRKRKARSRPALQSPKSASGPSERDPSSEMNGNERVIEISELNFRQQAVLPILAVSSSIAQAARDSGVAESTLRRWLKEPDFRKELDALRQESYDLARRQAQAVLPACISVVAETAFESQDPALRFRASCFLIRYATNITEIDRLRAELKDLDEAVSHVKDTKPLM